MAILRSRPVTGEPLTLGSPAVQRALQVWTQRIDEARASARSEASAATAAEHARRTAEAEAAAATARQAESAGIAAAEARVSARVAALETQLLARWGHLLTAGAALQEALAPAQSAAVRAAEREVLRLGVALAERILRQRLDADSTWIAPILAEVMGQVPDRRSVSLRVHPDDAAAAQAAAAALVAQDPALTLPRIDADAALRRGDLVVASAGTVLEAGLGGSLDRLAETLLAAAPAAEWQVPVTPAETPAEPAP
jgi:flagellar biosynthesis/type III secretory pathway protein FliH